MIGPFRAEGTGDECGFGRKPRIRSDYTARSLIIRRKLETNRGGKVVIRLTGRTARSTPHLLGEVSSARLSSHRPQDLAENHPEDSHPGMFITRKKKKKRRARLVELCPVSSHFLEAGVPLTIFVALLGRRIAQIQVHLRDILREQWEFLWSFFQNNMETKVSTCLALLDQCI